MKTFIKYVLQKLLGLQTYLYVFARFVIIKIRWDKKEKDFFHFMKLISDEGIILDLGANIGVTSYHQWFRRKHWSYKLSSFQKFSKKLDFFIWALNPKYEHFKTD